jgi:hypothetical protein
MPELRIAGLLSKGGLKWWNAIFVRDIVPWMKRGAVHAAHIMRKKMK